MKKTIFKKFRILSFLILSLGLASCGGDLDFDSIDSSSDSSESSDQIFTRAELAFTILFSSLVLNDSDDSDENGEDGFIVLFNTTSDLDEIELRANGDDDNALIGNYPWDIVDDELQVTYPDGVICTSEKTAETNSEITASNSCDGGEPNIDRIRDTLLRPIFLDDDDISTRNIRINNDDNDDGVEIDFLNDGTYEITDIDSDGDRVAGTTVVGIYSNSSDFPDAIRLDTVETGEFSLLILLEGSLDLGTMLELRYTTTTLTDTLNEVLIYSIDDNQWDTNNAYDDIDIDQ